MSATDQPKSVVSVPRASAIAARRSLNERFDIHGEHIAAFDAALAAAPLPQGEGSDAAKLIAYEDAHAVAVELGYPSLTEALEALAQPAPAPQVELGSSLRDRLTMAEADVAFLLARAGHAGSCSFRPGRWTGMSSNAIVAVAFGGEQTAMPSDRGDYAACVRTFARLPRHRRTEAVKDALRRARAAYLARYPGDRFPAGRAAAQADYERRRAEYYRGQTQSRKGE